jgi:two-component system LytT family response regulator/two-component system response regulator LytT
MLTVLIANDSAPILERLATLVSEVDGIELVGQASNAPDAIETIRWLKPDVVILGISMPGGGGFQVLEAIQIAGVGPVVIVLSADPYPQYGKRCLEAGAGYFLDKATGFEQIPEILKEVRRALAERGAAHPCEG